MRLPSKVLCVSTIAGAALLAACSGDFATAPLGPDDASFSETETGRVKVFKIGPAGTYPFVASENPSTGSLLLNEFDLAAGASAIVWSTSNPAVSADVTVEELAVPGIQVDSIRVNVWVGGTLESTTLLTGTSVAKVESVDQFRSAVMKFYNSETPVMGEGCTPGFWRQSQHFDSWVGYMPSDLYDDVFGVSYGGTLLEAVWAQGGGVDALARHSVAALLNATSPDVDYPATEAEVISAVQVAFLSGDFEDQKDIFEGWNEAGCMLD